MKVGSDSSHPELCERCTPVIQEMGFVPTAKDAAVANV